MGGVVAYSFVLGACLGSFLNVVVFRLPRGESLLWPGSRCPRCATRVRPHENIPLLSFVALRGRCRSCGAPLSLRYPLVEFLGGAVAVGAYLTWGASLDAGFGLVGLCALLAAALIDLDTYVIPDSTCVVVALAGVGWALASGGVSLVAARLLAGGCAAAFVWVVASVSRGGMGLGDAKLFGAMAIFLGPRDAAIAFAVAVVLGAVVGVGLMASGARRRGDPIPFGPFLVMGAFAASLTGEQIVRLWLRTASFPS